jgi:translation initiation factor IF-1
MFKRKQFAAQLKNNSAIDGVMEGSGVIGRVEKTLGNSAFQVMMGDGTLTQGLIRGVLKGGKNSVAFIAPGSFVILELSPRAKMHEILGVINDNKSLKKLKASGALPASLCENTNADELFEFEAEGEEKAELTTKGGYMAVKEGALKAEVSERVDLLSFEEPVAVYKKARVAPSAPVKAERPVEPTSIVPTWTSAWKDDVVSDSVPILKAPECWEDAVDIDAL